MRTHAINRFASSGVCRSLQDGGKTSLTVSSRVFSVLLFSLIVFSILLASVHRWLAATLAQHHRHSCEPVHRKHLNPTLCDGHHKRKTTLARDAIIRTAPLPERRRDPYSFRQTIRTLSSRQKGGERVWPTKDDPCVWPT